MIEGLKIQVTSDELVALFRKREKECAQEAEHLETIAKKISDGRNAPLHELEGEGFDGMSVLGSANRNAAQQHREVLRRAKHARQSAELQAFLAMHVIPKETYRLDLNAFGFVGGGGAIAAPGTFFGA